MLGRSQKIVKVQDLKWEQGAYPGADLITDFCKWLKTKQKA